MNIGRFMNEKGAKMTELLTAAQMRAVEAAAIASGSVTGLELMERAGAGVVAAVLAEWPETALTAHRAVVLCGPGNNGGDGFVVARLLALRGWEVVVALAGSVDALPPDAQHNARRWLKIGSVQDFVPGGDTDEAGFIEAGLFGPIGGGDGLHDHDRVVVVDALFGTGLTRPLRDAGYLLQELDLYRPDTVFGVRIHVVAVDMPSGVCADSGRVLRGAEFGTWRGEACRADLTVSFHVAKRGHMLDQGPAQCGKLVIVDIGLQQGGSDVALLATPDPKALAKSAGHKFAHGHALIVSGDHGHAGAARLAARAALRMGAGLVTVASPPGALAENAARLDAVMLRPVADAEGLRAILANDRITALCLGPGLGLDARAAAMVAVALETSRLRIGRWPEMGLRLVLDADALTLIARDPALFALLHEGCVLTPHGGEFARLFPDIAATLAAPATVCPAYSKLDATREAAARAGCVVLFKGADTVIAQPNGFGMIHGALYERAAPWLATAGSGDVLAGFITGLLARGMHTASAASTAAWLHVECARAFGPGLIAEDLADQLPGVFRRLGVS